MSDNTSDSSRKNAGVKGVKASRIIISAAALFILSFAIFNIQGYQF